MARKIILKENGLSGSTNTPTGYRYVGFDGGVISEKTGATVSSITGEPYYTVVLTNSMLLATASMDENNNGGLEIRVPSVIDGKRIILTSALLEINGTIEYPFAGNFYFQGESTTFQLLDQFLRSSGSISLIHDLQRGSVYTYYTPGSDYYFYMYHSQGSTTPTGTGEITIKFYYKIV